MNTGIAFEFNAATVASAHEGIPAVTGIQWTVLAGEIWIVGGLQGSGKSAILQAAMGLRSITHGAFKLFGEDLHPLSGGESRRLRQRMGLVFEGTGRLFSGLSVLDNLTLPLCYHTTVSPDEAAEAIVPLLDLMDLRGVAKKRPSQLGYGIAKRVALARALVLRPEILLTDDPLGGLDASQSRTILRILMQINIGHPWMNRRPTTLVITAEDLRPFLHLRPRFAVVSERRWQTIGTREELLNSQLASVTELLEVPAEPLPQADI